MFSDIVAFALIGLYQVEHYINLIASIHLYHYLDLYIGN